jgi:hypothetical protein
LRCRRRKVTPKKNGQNALTEFLRHFTGKLGMISNAQISEGTLNYLSMDPVETYKVKREYNETYEEALKAVRGEDLKL